MAKKKVKKAKTSEEIVHDEIMSLLGDLVCMAGPTPVILGLLRSIRGEVAMHIETLESDEELDDDDD